MSINDMVACHLSQGAHIETTRPFAKTAEGITVRAYRDRIISAEGKPIATLPASFRMHK